MTPLNPPSSGTTKPSSGGLWTPEAATAAPIVVTCAACGDPLTIPAALTDDLVPGARLVHDVCPRDQLPLRYYEVRLEVVDQTRLVGLRVYNALRGMFGVRTADDVPSQTLVEHFEAEAEVIAGFRVQTSATRLRDAVESFATPLAEKWQTLYEKAHLADDSAD